MKSLGFAILLLLTGCDPAVLQAVTESLEKTQADMAQMNRQHCAAARKYFDIATGTCHYDLPADLGVSYGDDEASPHQQLHQCLDECHQRFGVDGDDFDSERLGACRVECSDRFER